jgi:hypothetical protein
MNVAGTLRAAVHALSDRADLVHAPMEAAVAEVAVEQNEQSSIKQMGMIRRAGQDCGRRRH